MGRRRLRESANVNASTLVGTVKTYLNGNLTGTSPRTYNPYTMRGAYNRQEVCLDVTNPGPPYRTGGAFTAFQWSDPGILPVATGTYSSNTTPWLYEYSGGFLPLATWQSFGAYYGVSKFAADVITPGTHYSSELDGSSYGATGWKRFRPGNPTADLGVFVGEFRDVPRMLKDTAKFFTNAWRAAGGTLKKPSRALANHWLSTQFGWLPFINDLRKFHRTYVTMNERIAQIRRNNGRWVRRGGTVMEDNDSTVISSSSTATGHWPSLPSYLYKNSQVTGSQTKSLHRITRVWFEGSFRYWIPNIESRTWEKRAVAELYGAMPNPALVWELTPFSWLVDWMSNVGDVVANMDNGWADNLVARYAYVMKSVEVVGEFTSTCDLKDTTLHNSWDFLVSWKTRGGASRFGFGLTEANFSPRQWSILAALGIQRYR